MDTYAIGFFLVFGWMEMDTFDVEVAIFDGVLVLLCVWMLFSEEGRMSSRGKRFQSKETKSETTTTHGNHQIIRFCTISIMPSGAESGKGSTHQRWLRKED